MSALAEALNNDIAQCAQWIVCPVCLEVDVAWAGVCRCGREMVRVYSEDAIKRAEVAVLDAPGKG